MSIFKYTLPSGAEYIVETPAGYTQAQADYVFYGQVAAGSLVGYNNGQSLSSAETKLTKFGLSRLDRGTAGVDILSILAIIYGSPIVAKTPNLTNVPLTNPINSAAFALAGTPLGVTPVGPLTGPQTQALLAQQANLINQSANTVTSQGVGTYNLGPNQLEQAGYLKPGTSNYPDFNCVIGTPSVWTGKDGVYSLVDIVGDPALQTQIQTQVMQNSYDALTASGTIQSTPTNAASVSTGQVYTNSGLSTLTAASLVSGTAVLSGSLNGLVSKAFAGAPNLSSLLSNPVDNISTLASGAVNNVTQSIAGLGTTALATANNLVTGTLSSLTGQANSLVNTALGTSLAQASSLVSGLSNSVNGAVGSLITNASQFGSPVTALWASGSGALSTALGSATGLANSALSTVTGALGSATGALTGALGDLTSLASGALGTLQGQASSLLTSLGGSLDIFGKMSNFSIDFSLFSSDSLVSATKVAAGFSNTVNRQTVDAAVTRILGNAKIPNPTFEYPSLGAQNLGADIQFAQQQLQSLVGQAQGAITNAVGATNTVLAQARTAANGLIGP